MNTVMIVLAIAMFGCSTFGIGCLLMITGILFKRSFPTQTKPLLVDTLIVFCVTAFCLLLNCSSLVWDTFNEGHLPLLIRWPLLAVLVPIVTRSSMRLLRYYLTHETEDANGQGPPKIDPAQPAAPDRN